MPVRHVISVAVIRQKLLRWFRTRARQYAWRETDDPYQILIAEMMLRRTQAAQVEPVYQAFIREFPDARKLDAADENRIAALVRPLGLNWRTPAFKNIARQLGELHDYSIPSTRAELTALPGVGDYVAGAVLSMAFHQREWIADTNVARVFVRLFGLQPRGEARRDRQVIALASEYVSGHEPRRANLALLDFAAIVCKALKPDCYHCPLKRDCWFFQNIRSTEKQKR